MNTHWDYHLYELCNKEENKESEIIDQNKKEIILQDNNNDTKEENKNSNRKFDQENIKEFIKNINCPIETNKQKINEYKIKDAQNNNDIIYYVYV